MGRIERHRTSGPAPVPGLFVAAASLNDFVDTTAVATLANTGGQGVNFIVIAANNYDSVQSQLSVSDTINGSPSGNVWTPVTVIGTPDVGVTGVPFFWYCYDPNVGTSHVFTASNPTGDQCPRIAVQCFKGMPLSGGPNRDENWIGVGGSYLPLRSANYGLGLTSPLKVGDLIVVACGVGLGNGKTFTCDSGVTVTCAADSTPYNLFGIAAGYALATVPSQPCLGTVVVDLLGSTLTVSVASTANFVLPQICTGDVNVTSTISADIYLADTTGFYVGMSVYLTGFSGVVGTDFNTQVWQLSAVASDHITVIGSGGAFNHTGSFTGQSGTVYQNVTIDGFTGALAIANDSVGVQVTAIGSGTVSVYVGTSIASGPYTGQSAGVVGLPVCPNWYWNYAGISNEAGLGMVIFPGS